MLCVLVLIAVTKGNILSTIALLVGVMGQVKAYDARSLKLLCFATPCQNLGESAGIPLSVKIFLHTALPDKLFYIVLLLHCYIP